MDGQLIGLVAVIMSLGIPLGAMYTYYRVRKLRSEERLAAIAGVTGRHVRDKPSPWVGANVGKGSCNSLWGCTQIVVR